MKKEKIYIWGTGAVANQVLSQNDLFEDFEILGFIDNNESRKGTCFVGRKVFGAEILNENNPDRIVILTDFYEEIVKQITEELKICNIPIENKNFFYKHNLLKRYNDTTEPEIRETIDYIKENNLQVFNAPFVKRYADIPVEVEFDEDNGLFYLYHQGKKMYISRKYDTADKVIRYYRSILLEQDMMSPHRYLTDDFQVEDGDVVVDVGVAEGNFSLEIIDKASHIYMIEADTYWVEALELTFEQYRDKVTIIPQYASSLNDGAYTTMDAVIKDKVNFIKMDIEGYEWDALTGAADIFNKAEHIKCAICAYHSDYDETLIRNVLGKYGLACSTTNGYMWFNGYGRKNYISTKLVRGLVRGTK